MSANRVISSTGDSEAGVAQTDERRKWPRLDVSLKIRLKPLQQPKEEAAEKYYYTRNISTGGLFFEGESPAQVSEGTVFDVEISMPLARYGFSSARRLEARGKVCRVEGSPDTDRTGVAVEFMAPPRFVTP